MGQYEAKLKPLIKEDVQAIMDGCALTNYAGSRDYAMLQLIVNSGIARLDMAELTLDSITEDYIILRRGINVPLIGNKVRRVLASYLSIRAGLPTETRALFVNGQTMEPLTDRQIGHIVAARCRRVRDDVPHPYDALRFYFVQRWLKVGGAVADLEPVFADKRGHRRLLEMAAPTQPPQERKKRLERLQEMKEQVVRWYVEQGLSFKEIYRRYQVPERAARTCLELAGHKPRTVSEAAQMRYTKDPDSSPVGKRLQEMGMRAWQQEERYGHALLKLLVEQGEASLPQIYAAGFSRRQYEHARDWLVANGYAAYDRSQNVRLALTDQGRHRYGEMVQNIN